MVSLVFIILWATVFVAAWNMSYRKDIQETCKDGKYHAWIITNDKQSMLCVNCDYHLYLDDL